jgi:hypothetical protein
MVLTFDKVVELANENEKFIRSEQDALKRANEMPDLPIRKLSLITQEGITKFVANPRFGSRKKSIV